MRILWMIGGIWLMVAAPLRAQVDELELPLTYSDTFAGSTLEEYETHGKVQWQTGRLTLAQDAKVTKGIVGGSHLEIELRIDWTEVKQERPSAS
ncbi:hypothetical protein [Roseimaritima sediminicola]|uniref:hypothetical protein n=1 Tax=Roseimaritima sediminicola TaxID=2662066 RepID=UPI0012984048|nr:hypothetical protein [Roseimaritima sediminicola]